MAHGLITITANNIVVMKIIAGSGGENIQKIIKEIKSKPQMATNRLMAYLIAKSFGFGTEADLVVVVTDFEPAHRMTKDELPPLYRSTLSDPKFNPQTESEKTQYYQLITV